MEVYDGVRAVLVRAWYEEYSYMSPSPCPHQHSSAPTQLTHRRTPPHDLAQVTRAFLRWSVKTFEVGLGSGGLYFV